MHTLAASTTTSIVDMGTPPMSTLPAVLAATGSASSFFGGIAAGLFVVGVVSWTAARRL